MQHVITLPVPVAARSVGLGFYARSITIDNPTSQWLAIGDQIIAPYLVGQIARLSYATTVGEIKPVSPPAGIAAVAPSPAGAFITVRFSDEILSPAPGISLTPVALTPTAPSALTVTTVVRAVNASSGSVSPALPVGLLAGDIMLLAVVVGAGAINAVISITTPVGWSLVTSAALSDANGATTLALYWRAWVSGDAAPSVTWTQTNGQGSAIASIVLVRGGNAAPIDGSQSSSAAAVSTLAITGASVTGQNELAIYIFGTGVFGPAAGSTTIPSGLIAIIQDVFSGGSAGGPTALTITRLGVQPGTSPSETFSYTLAGKECGICAIITS